MTPSSSAPAPPGSAPRWRSPARAPGSTRGRGARPSAGGLCVTRRRDGFAYDVGGHIPFVRDEARLAWLRDLLGGDLRWVDRPGGLRARRPRRARPLPRPAPRRARAARRRATARPAASWARASGRAFVDRGDAPLPGEDRRASRWSASPASAPAACWRTRPPPTASASPPTASASSWTRWPRRPRAAGARRAPRRRRREAHRGARRARLAARCGRPTATAGAAPPARGRGDARRRGGAAGRAAAPARGHPRGSRMRAVCIVYLAIEPASASRAEPWIQVDDPACRSRAPSSRSTGARALAPPGAHRDRPGVLLPGRGRRPGLGPARRAARGGLRARRWRDPLGWLDDPARPRGRSRWCGCPAPTRCPTSPSCRRSGPPRCGSTALEGVHLAPGAAVIEAIEAGERAARAVLEGRPAPAGGPVARCPRSASVDRWRRVRGTRDRRALRGAARPRARDRPPARAPPLLAATARSPRATAVWWCCPRRPTRSAACVRLAAELGLAVVPRGSGTGLCGGAVPLDGASCCRSRA